MPLTRLVKVGIVVPTLFLYVSMVHSAVSQPLTDSLTHYLRQLPASARVSISVQSLIVNKEAFAHRATERVPSASVIKLPIMVEVMERVKAGTFDLDGIHTLQRAEIVGGSGVLQTYPDQSRIRYHELLRLMMVESDNTATNIFIQQLSRTAINQRIKTLGLVQTQLNRVMMDTLAAKQGRENYVTAGEMNRLLEKIYRKQVATPKLCDDMLTILKQNRDTLCIARLLPKQTVIAHKTGTLTYVRGDAGIVYMRQPFLLSVFVEGVPTEEAEQIIGQIALTCYTYFSR